jgi:AcrR family transcriptional regulator
VPTGERAVTATRGRPRDPAVHRAILGATVDLLERVGYGRLTIDAIATQARVGKQTIYRWWPNKASLVMEAFIGAGEERVPEPDTGSVETDLLAILVPVFAQNADYGQGVAMANKGMMAEAQLDPEFHAAYLALHRSWWEPMRNVLRRGQARGELAAGVDPGDLIDLLLGASWYRTLLEHAPLDEAFARFLVRTVLDGHRSHPG